MNLKRVYELMKIERECIRRAGSEICNRECEKCDLLQKDIDLIAAYDTIIKILELFLKIENNFDREKIVF